MRLFSNYAWTTRRRLLLLAVAILTPLALFAVVLATEFAAAEHTRGRADALAAAQSLSNIIDRELVGMTAALEALAASPSLAPGGNLEDFTRQARDVLRRRGYSVVMRDRSGQQIVNTLLRPGAPLPRSVDPIVLATDRRVFETGAPVVSDLFRAASSDQPLVIVDAPVFRDGQVVAAVGISLDPSQLSSILAEAAKKGWTIALIDRNDVIVARSRRPEAYVGKVATDDLRHNAQGGSGVWSGWTIDRIAVMSAYARSPISGWRVAVGVGLDTIYAPLRRLTVVILISGALTAALALALALVVARTISQPIAQLAQAADRLERGEKVPLVSTGLVEVDEVGAALASADVAIGTREAALQASEERFRAAVQAVEGVIWTNDAAGRMVGDQPGWAALTGQSYDEYQGYGWAKSVHPEDANPTVKAWEEAVRERKPFVFRHRVRRHDGVYRHFSIRAIPVLSAQGEISSWVGVHTDITDEHEAKARLAAQEAALRDLNATLERRVEDIRAERDRIWRISTELMMIARFDGTIVDTNPAWSATLAWGEAELRGRSMTDLVHPDDVAATVDQMGQLARGAPKLGYESRYRHRDGSHRWMSWTAVPEAGLVFAIGRDITVEHDAAEALRRTEEQLRQSQKMDVVGQLTGGIAHDFNNLLTVVTGHLEMAKRRLETDLDPTRLLRNIGAALEGARRAAVLTHRLLAFSRQSALQPEVLDLNAVVVGMTDLIRRTLGERIRIETNLADDLWPAEADQNQLENSILNLCVNARDAMPAGGELRIETRNVTLGPGAPLVSSGAIPPGDYALIAVGDNGEGIPEAIRARVFEPFFTTKPVGKGTGLGLSQVFGFMSQSGGLATVDSIVGVGTTVTLLLPRCLQPARPGPPEESPAPKIPGRGGACLIVEDEDMVREFAVTALEEAGYHVLHARDADAGLAILDAHPEIELLFTDIVLAGSASGLELATRARLSRPGLKVIYTTGYIPDTKGVDRPPDADIITKPFTAEALVDRINVILAPSAAQTAG